MKIKLKKKLNAFFITKFAWLWKYWYVVTLFFTREKNYRVKYLEDISLIAEALYFGAKYKPDPRLDIMFHPTKIQKMLDGKKEIEHFDCDDHSGYWAVQIKKPNLAPKVYVGYTYYLKPDGKFGGHAVCVYKDSDHKYWWADYNHPVKTPGKWDWALAAAAQFGTTPYCAVLTEVSKVSAKDTPKFGKIETRIF